MGILGWGQSVAEAFEEAAAAMFDLMIEPGEYKQAVIGEVACNGNTLVELLIEFLNGILSISDRKEMAAVCVDVERISMSDGGWSLESRVFGISRAEAGGNLLTEVKAATYYGSSVAKGTDPDRWEAKCVVDL